MEISYNTQLSWPFTMQISGPTGAGKSMFVFQLLNNAAHIIDHPPQTIYYCYGEWQKAFEKISNVNFIPGFDTRHNL